MTLYVRGENDTFWHWCKNCEKYPSDIEQTTTKRPTEDLCPECYENQASGNCESVNTEVGPFIGVI